jgi:hypothetical protein
LTASIKESRPAARRRDQLRRPDEAIRRSARPCNDAHAARAEILLEQHAFSRQAVPFRLTQSRISVPSPHGRRGRAPKTPTLLDVLLGTRETKTSKSSTLSSASAGLEPTSHSVTDTRIVGGGIMSKRNLVIEEGGVEALARLQKQDEEFCRRLRAAIETGRECCPTTVFTEPCTNRPVSNYMRPDLMHGYRSC